MRLTGRVERRMTNRDRAHPSVRAAVLACVVAWLGPSSVFADGPRWQVGTASVRIVCPLTVGGSFEAKTAALSGSLAFVAPAMPLTGELAVDLKTLDTGIELRNSHLRANYLEVDKGAGYDRAVLSNIILADKDAATYEGRTSFNGTLLLHGIAKPIRGEATIRRDGESRRIDASFPVVLSDFGIALPQYMGVGVRNQVQASISFVATTVTAGPAGHE